MQQINDLSAKIKKFHSEIKTSIDRVVTSGWLILGPEVRNFERNFADYLGTNHCITLANGTDAIELALRGMGVGPNDRVATVANAGMYTTTAVLAVGAKPFFMDVDFDTHGVTLAEVVRAVESGVKAVVVTHIYGLAIPEISAIAKYCAEKSIPLLEDCAQAHGAKTDGKRVGTFGDAASFSFYPTKNLGALGDGGAVVTNSAVIAEKIERLRQYGWTSKYKVTVQNARNSRLDEIQAAILSEFLPYLDESNARRRQIAAQYSARISHPNVRLPKEGGDDYVAHLYVVHCQQRDKLRGHLRTMEIASDIHYPIPDYRQPVFGNTYSDVRLEITEKLSNEILTLPCYPEMSNDEVSAVIVAVNGWQA